MIYINDEKIYKELIGNKAYNLTLLKKEGFNVPDFIVITDESLEKISVNDEGEIEKLFNYIDLGKKYAIRSSATKEDLQSLSFAGMYESYLNITGKDNIVTAIKKCYETRKSKQVIEYCKKNNIDYKQIKMAVIIQEMVEAKVSCISFSVNVITGKDTEVIIETVKGLGDKNANGELNPEKYIYDWYNQELKKQEGNLLSKEQIEEIAKIVLELQQYFGFPVDVELAIDDEKIWILQVRQITKILYSNLQNQWTTANFKDGGVSSTVCLPFLWSLYQKVYNKVAKDFFLNLRVYKEKEITSQIENFFSRPYWNVTACKVGLCKLPGFVERDYDNELGITKYYEGEGKVSKLSIKDWFNLPKIVVNYLMVENKQKRTWGNFKNNSLNKFKELSALDLKNLDLVALENVWKQLVVKDYFEVETTYFLQVFINIVKQTLFKKKMMKEYEYSEYLQLLSNIKNISHMKSSEMFNSIISSIQNDEKIYRYWMENNVETIYEDYQKNLNENSFVLVKEFIDEFGYHSDRELDLTYKSYYEDIPGVILRIKKSITNEMSNEKEEKIEFEKYIKNPKDKKSIAGMREALWVREELKDLSIRYYYLIRKYTNELAKRYKNLGIINDELDIYCLTQTDLINYIDKKIDIKEFEKILRKNKAYYNSFRNFENPTDIGNVYIDNESSKEEYKTLLKGVGCNDKIVTGKVRVIKDVENIDELRSGEILVTKYIDTGWTSRFGILKGVISEAGGVLCHSSIVAREYGISAIVSAKDICKHLNTGDIIQMNGRTGEIKVLKEYKDDKNI